MTGRDVWNAILTWFTAHTIATAAILGFFAGWLLPKIVGWLA